LPPIAHGLLRWKSGLERGRLPLMPAIDETSRCTRCGEVIGVYEPLVIVEGGGPRDSSLAAEPALAGASAKLYHRSCHAAFAEQFKRTGRA
jgi:hypothetical protein